MIFRSEVKYEIIFWFIPPVLLEKLLSNLIKWLMTQQQPVAFSTSVALQISHVLSAEILVFYCKHSQQQGYEEEWPSGLHQFFSFCLVRPAGGCAPSWSCCSNFDSKQRHCKLAKMKYYPQMNTFTWKTYGELKCTATDLGPNICHTNHIVLIAVTEWILDFFEVPFEILCICYSSPNELDIMGSNKSKCL